MSVSPEPDLRVFADGQVLVQSDDLLFEWFTARLSPEGLSQLRRCSDDARFADLPSRLEEHSSVAPCEVADLNTESIVLPTDEGTHRVSVSHDEDYCGALLREFTAPRDLLRRLDTDVKARRERWAPPSLRLMIRADRPESRLDRIPAEPWPLSALDVPEQGPMEVFGADVDVLMQMAVERRSSGFVFTLPDGRRIGASFRVHVPGE